MATSKNKLTLNVDGRIWIITAEGKLVGKGRIELMEKIKQFGSIRQAALAMQMSYRQAWQLIDDMNSKAKTPLVISNRGGKGGGSASGQLIQGKYAGYEFQKTPIELVNYHEKCPI